MARLKDENELTPQQELFCQYVVDEYGTDTYGILSVAYRKAYNCEKAKPESVYSLASRLFKQAKIRSRVKQLKKELAKASTITREELITSLKNRMKIDPVDLFIEEDGVYRLRKMQEIPKRTRVLIPRFRKVGDDFVPDIDKDTAIKMLIDILGFSSTDINVNADFGTGAILSVGFGKVED